ncbi:hypothetical protein ACIBCA_13530 [Kitasatospora sp. NPDC051170]|uniref:hypothetical protein n=1 Tax=Kitasatospora sp. NPDC051170 TaxID=3364056 RepID=UPI00378EEBB2
MFTNPSTRRSRVLAAATVVAAIGAATLTPAVAFASTTASGTAPLVASLTQNAGQATLTRTGSGADLTLTVTNNSDTAQPFHPAVKVTPVGGANPVVPSWVDFNAKAISAPSTDVIPSWDANNAFTGTVVPTSTYSTFKVPAHTTYTWAVSAKVKAALPAADTAVKIELANDQNDSANSAPGTLQVASPTGALFQNFSNLWGTVSASTPYTTDVTVTNNGAPINAAINPTLHWGNGAVTAPVSLKLDVLQGGSWTPVAGTNSTWALPGLTGLGQGQSQTYKVRLSLGTGGASIFAAGTLSLLPSTGQFPVDTDITASVAVNALG